VQHVQGEQLMMEVFLVNRRNYCPGGLPYRAGKIGILPYDWGG
jgi:hypothetical protein